MRQILHDIFDKMQIPVFIDNKLKNLIKQTYNKNNKKKERKSWTNY